MIRLGGAVAIAFVLAACAEHNAQTKALCPGMSQPRCISGVICEHDTARDCEVCRCESPYLVPESQPPQGMPQPIPR